MELYLWIERHNIIILIGCVIYCLLFLLLNAFWYVSFICFSTDFLLSNFPPTSATCISLTTSIWISVHYICIFFYICTETEADDDAVIILDWWFRELNWQFPWVVTKASSETDLTFAIIGAARIEFFNSPHVWKIKWRNKCLSNCNFSMCSYNLEESTWTYSVFTPWSCCNHTCCSSTW